MFRHGLSSVLRGPYWLFALLTVGLLAVGGWALANVATGGTNLVTHVQHVSSIIVTGLTIAVIGVVMIDGLRHARQLRSTLVISLFVAAAAATGILAGATVMPLAVTAIVTVAFAYDRNRRMPTTWLTTRSRFPRLSPFVRPTAICRT